MKALKSLGLAIFVFFIILLITFSFGLWSMNYLSLNEDTSNNAPLNSISSISGEQEYIDLCKEKCDSDSVRNAPNLDLPEEMKYMGYEILDNRIYCQCGPTTVSIISLP